MCDGGGRRFESRYVEDGQLGGDLEIGIGP